ncbi:hypothetical protein [Rufibacter roseus]|uniref:Adhesin domain-containing protein n=1 Tax=Rufibacter roseus TaxID=1567108 RepID=A0ABW2DL10_9BACT|nr:hypothetical protein [Rufibacter roseus]
MKPLRRSNILLLLAACLSFTGVKAQRASVNCGTKTATGNTQVQVQIPQIDGLESLASLAAVPFSEVSSESLESLASLENFEDVPVAAKVGSAVVVINGAVQPEPFAAEKHKNLTRTFKVKSTDKLSIENQFGEVTVQTWARNEIAVEVNIVTRAATDAKAQEIMDRIDVEVSERGNVIAFVTNLQPMQIRSSSMKSFEVNYIIKMPKINPLHISHRFGNVHLPNFEGTTDITVKHGGIMAGRLTNKQNSIVLEHARGDNSVEYLKAADLRIRHSTFKITEADQLVLNSAHSMITIGKVETLSVESQHDPVFKMGSVNQLSGKGSFTVFKLGNLTESAKLDLRHGPKFEIGSVGQNFKRIDINGEFTQINLNFSDKNAFNFDVNTEHCTGLRANPDLVKLNFKEVRNTSASYKGNYGTTSPKGVVVVNAKHGSVAFN